MTLRDNVNVVGWHGRAQAVRDRLATLQIKPLYIEPGSPWENGCIESFHDKLRDELLNLELFDTLYEAKVLLGR